MQEWVTAEEFKRLTEPLIGMEVSRTWRGYGTAIFFELGTLATGKYTSGSQHGEAGVMLEVSWRVERKKTIYFGSFSDSKRISNGLSQLIGLKVVAITTEGRLPELVLHLSNNIWVHSFNTIAGDPQWCLFLPDNSNLTSRLARLQRKSKDVAT